VGGGAEGPATDRNPARGRVKGPGKSLPPPAASGMLYLDADRVGPAPGGRCMDVYADVQLVARFRDGDPAALDAVFERYERPVFQFLLGLLRDHHRAEDALQETFVKALEQIDRVDPAKLRGWLYTVAYRQAMLVRRRRRYQPALDEAPLLAAADAAADPTGLAESREEAGRLRELLGRLPAAQRE